MIETIDSRDHDNDSSDIELLPYYVYELRDPRTNVVFYVGKGTRDRLDSHTAEEEGAKALRIAEIERAGLAVVRVIVGRFRTEEEAFAVETVSIKWVYGFANLTNRVHGHRHRFVRSFEEKASAVYREIPGIDRRRTISVGRDGTFTSSLRERISENQVLEKLESLRDALRQRPEFTDLNISEPDLLAPADPCILVSGFEPSAIQLQIKMQLSGATVVLNLVPADRRRLDEFVTALTEIEAPFEVKNGNSRFGGKYTQTHDFTSKDGGYPRGVPQDDVASIARLSLEALSRLTTPKGP
jgi:hypothetical protein